MRGQKNVLGKDFQIQYSPNSNEALYYSSWVYSAIHILMTIPEFNSVKKIAEALRIRFSEAEVGLKILEGIRVVRAKGEKWMLEKNHIFISNKNALAQYYHSSWSDRLNSSLSVVNPEHVRYTGIHSISK